MRSIPYPIYALRTGLSGLLLLAAVSVSAQEPDEIRAAVVAISEPQVIQEVAAPDGSQTAVVTAYPCVDIGGQEVSYERLDLINASTNETQLVAEQTIYCGGLGGYGLAILRWTENATFLYYTDAREGVPDGLTASWVPPIWRVQVADVQVTPLGQARFSPDGTQLVTWNQSQIQVLPADSDDVISFDVIPDGLQILSVLWLPDSTGILYLQADAPFNSMRSVVTYLDLGTQAQTVLLDNGG
jgi:hypothetical protein